MASLLDVPEEVIRYVSKFLMIEDVVHLSMTCKYLYHKLPAYSLKEKVIDMPNTSRMVDHWEKDMYRTFDFETPPFTSSIFMASISASISCKDCDQRSSDQEINNITVQLIRPGMPPNTPKIIMEEYVIEDAFDSLFKRLIHHAKYIIRYFCIEDPIINMIQPGDYFRFKKSGDRYNNRIVKLINFTLHTRALLIRPNKILQGSNNNSLTNYNNQRHGIETLQINKGSLVNVTKMLRRHDHDLHLIDYGNHRRCIFCS